MADLFKVTENFYVAPQLSVDEMDEVAREGFSTVIFNRPDEEEDDQPALFDLIARTEANGMTFVHIPIEGVPTTADVQATLRTLDEAGDQKVLAFCRSGTRSITLWILAMTRNGRLTLDEALGLAEAAGYKLRAHIQAMESVTA